MNTFKMRFEKISKIDMSQGQPLKLITLFAKLLTLFAIELLKIY